MLQLPNPDLCGIRKHRPAPHTYNVTTIVVELSKIMAFKYGSRKSSKDIEVFFRLIHLVSVTLASGERARFVPTETHTSGLATGLINCAPRFALTRRCQVK